MAGDDWTSIREVKQAANGRFAIRCQVEAVRQRLTKTGKPFLELALRDAEDSLTLKVWEDNPVFSTATGLKPGNFIEVVGDWTTGNYGLECKDWGLSLLDEDEVGAVLHGSDSLRQKQTEDWDDIAAFVAGMVDPRLRTLCQWFLDDYGERFRRTAAARDYHHARRGGLVEHVAQMMRTADAICGVYPTLNRDLVLAGVLFHDCGKLWENSFPENGFVMPVQEAGEMLGHITIGLELINRLWRDLMQNEEAEEWKSLEPANEHVRLHLLHLVASHHGEYEFGSPVLPRTPEAMVLHHVDNIDAKLEMMFRGYETSPEVGRNVLERVRPLPARLVKPLAHFHFKPADPDPTETDGDQEAQPRGS